VVELPEDSTVPRVATCSPTTSRKTGSVGITIEHSCSMQHKKHSYTSSTDKTKFDVGQLRTDRDNSLALWMASSVIRSHRGTLNVLIENGKAVTDIQLPLAADTSAVSIPSSQNSQRNDSWDGIKRSSSFTTVRGVKLSPIGNDDSVPVQFAPDQNCESIDASYDSSVEKESSFTLKILVVDDVLSNRKILSALLKAKGHECSMAADGLECMELVEEGSLPGHKQFDAICMDYEMPNCNGPEATRRLRELGYYIPVV
ncbi:dhkB, partial [Symbiodinium microadriaticum]